MDLAQKDLLALIHPSLVRHDYTSREYVVLGTLAGFLSCLSLLGVFYCCIALQRWLQKLSSSELWMISHRLTIGFCSILSVIVGVYHTFRDNPAKQDPVNGRTHCLDAYLPLMLGFAFYDMLFNAFVSVDSEASPINTIKRVCTMTIASAIISSGKGFGLFANFILMDSIKLPTAIHMMFEKAGLTDGWVYKKNLSTLLHLFHASNILQCYIWLQMYRNASKISAELSVLMLMAFTIHLAVVTFYDTPKKCLDYSRILYGKQNQTNGTLKSKEASARKKE